MIVTQIIYHKQTMFVGLKSINTNFRINNCKYTHSLTNVYRNLDRMAVQQPAVDRILQRGSSTFQRIPPHTRCHQVHTLLQSPLRYYHSVVSVLSTQSSTMKIENLHSPPGWIILEFWKLYTCLRFWHGVPPRFHTGRYDCIATNDVGTSDRSAYITINRKSYHHIEHLHLHQLRLVLSNPMNPWPYHIFVYCPHFWDAHFTNESFSSTNRKGHRPPMLTCR